MKINLIRNIDYWLGIPICFFLSIIYRIQRFFISREPKAADFKKVMFLELSEMGSAILAYSAIQKIKQMYPNSRMYFWIFKRNQDSVRILDIIPAKNVITIRDENLFLLIKDVIGNLRRIWKEKIDVVIDMELFSRFTSILSYLSKAAVRVGFHKYSMEGLYRGALHTHQVDYNPYMHISKNFLTLVQSLKADPEDAPLLKAEIANCDTAVPKINSSAEAKEAIWEKLKRFNSSISRQNKIIILNPGVSDILPLRRWPIENYIELVRKLLNDPQIFIVTIGLDLDSAGGELLHQEISSPRVINFIGKTTIRELLDLYSISVLLVSHDSGATNLASLTDINIIVLFGPETPMLYAPLTANKTVLYANLACSPCITAYNHRHSRCKNNKCMQTITVDEVYNEAARIV